jgi:hypothetical protein
MIAPLRFLFLPLFAASGLSGAPSLTLDLSAPPPGANITRVFGHGGNGEGRAGVPVCGGLDCDGDGHRDVAFAQFQADPFGRFVAGEVTVVFGNGTIGGTKDSAVPQSGILIIAGDQPFEATGSEAWLDDITGDGLGDLLIGRQNYSLQGVPGRPGAGALTVLVGSGAWKTHAATLAPLDLRTPPPELRLITFVGPSAYDRLGIWMRTGDITGDGIADLVVAADEVDGAGESVSHNQGAVFVIRGGPHLLDSPAIVDLATFGTPSFPANLKGHVARIDPPAGSGNYHLGATVQVGDLDNNGRAEVIAAATINRAGAAVRLPEAPSGTGVASGGSADGTTFIIWDENFPPGAWPGNHRFEATSPPFGDHTRIDGDTAARSFGEELLAGLDFSGDGFPDLMIGDLVAAPLSRSNAGRGYIFYNAGNLRGLDFKLNLSLLPPGVAVTTIDGPRAGAISSDTALLGDFDGDGIGDLGIGNPHDDPELRPDAGSLHVLYGQAGGWPAKIDLRPDKLPGPDTMRIALVQGALGASGNTEGDTLCYSAAAGDINNDGRPDLIVNEMAGDGAGGSPTDIGNLLVIDAASLLAPFLPTIGSGLPGPLDFGTVLASSGTSSRTLTITNTSAAPVVITGLAIAGPAASHFAITADTGETSLGIGGVRTLTITYDPAFTGRSGAAVVIQTDSDSHSIGFGLSGRAVDTGLAVPALLFRLDGNDALFEIPESQFGTDYTLLRDPTLGSPTPLLTIPGNGRTVYLSDPDALDVFSAAFYRVTAQRE